jgi:hypothetical protein
MRKFIMNGEWLSIRKDNVVNYFTVVSRHLPGKTEEHHETQDGKLPGRDSRTTEFKYRYCTRLNGNPCFQCPSTQCGFERSKR